MRFIIFGDSKGANNGINTKVLKTIMEQSIKLNPKVDFIVVCGDSIAGGPNKERLISQLNNFKKIVQSYHPNKSILPVIGNHEVNINPIDNSYEKIFENIYDELKPNGYLENYNKTVYYIDFRDTRIIILNTFHPNEIHKIVDDQLYWFEKVASVNIKNKFVVFHSPAFPTGAHLGHCLDLYPDYRDEFWKVVDKCNIDIVFSSHEHNYSRRIIHGENDIYQIITGGGGEKLRDKYKSKNGVVVPPIATYHFVVVDINEHFIEVSSITTKGKILDNFRINK